jgi:hypothetical protein
MEIKNDPKNARVKIAGALLELKGTFFIFHRKKRLLNKTVLSNVSFYITF